MLVASDDESTILNRGLGSVASGRRAWPVSPPSLEERPLPADKLALAGAQLVGGVEVTLVSAVPLKRHQVLVVEHQVGAFVESGEDVKRIVQLRRQPPRFWVSGG